jgi:hypothetical protein
MAIPDSTQRRINKLVDRNLFNTEAQYHAQVQLMQRWLDMTKMAMEDEGLDYTLIERVLNRVVYGAPNPYDGYERVDMQKLMHELNMRMPIDTAKLMESMGVTGQTVPPKRPYTHEEGLPRRSHGASETPAGGVHDAWKSR